MRKSAISLEGALKASEALIAWNPGEPGRPSTAVEIGPLLSDGMRDWTIPYHLTGGAAYVHVRKLSGEKSALRAFVDFTKLVVENHVDPQAAHREFLKIDEYVERVSPESSGSNEV